MVYETRRYRLKTTAPLGVSASPRLRGEIRLYRSGKFSSRNFIAFSPIIFRISSSE
jgi:hypothetical protein